MARTSVVESPPAARQAVVVREGPPQAKGRRLDIVIGVVGLLLIAIAGSLVQVLPERDVLLPQFRVTVYDQESTLSMTRAYIADGDEHDFLLEPELPDSVFRVVLSVGFEDDLPASAPDTFRFGLRDPQETLASDKDVTLVGKMPQRDSNETVPTYLSPFTAHIERYDIFNRPQDDIVTGISEDETEIEVKERLMQEYFHETAGQWSVHVVMVGAGDCPQPTVDAERYYACTGGAGENAGSDGGNDFIIQGLTYLTFVLDVEKLE